MKLTIKNIFGIKISFRILIFIIIVIISYIFVREIDRGIFIIAYPILIFGLGYFFVFKPIFITEKILYSALSGDYTQVKVLKSFGESGDYINSLLNRLLISQESLNILSVASRVITSHIEISDIMNMLLDLACDKMTMPSAFITLKDNDGTIRIKLSRGLSDEFTRNFNLSENEDFYGRDFLTKEIVIINNTVKNKLSKYEEIFLQEGIMSFVQIPIIVNDKVVGTFNANARVKGFFDNNIVKTVATLADYLAIAMENYGMYQDMQEFNKRLELEVESTTEELTNTNIRLIAKVKEMKALNDIIFSVSSKVDMNEMFLAIIEKIKIITNVSFAGFMIYNEHTDSLSGYGDIKGFELQIAENTNSILIKSFKNITSFISNELFMENYSDLKDLYNNRRITSLAVLPIVEKKAIGLFVLGNKTLGRFSQEDMRFLSVVSSQISELIGRVKLYEQLNRRINDLLILRDISNTIKTEPKLEEILEVIAGKTVKSLESDYAFCWLFNKTGEKLVPKYPIEYINNESMEFDVKSDSPIIKIFLEGKIQSVTDIEFNNELDDICKKNAIKTTLIIPLKVEGKKIGFFCFCSKKQNVFNEEIIHLADSIAGQVAVIVENARIHSRLKEINVELEKLNKVKNDFVSMVSHEMRTPLTAIKGFVHVVLNEDAGKLNENQKKFLGIVKQSINHLNLLISDFLDLSKIERGLIVLKLERGNITDIVKKSIMSNINQIKEKEIELKVDVDENIPDIEIDSARILQVFNNLISNAIKFTSSEGIITITVKDKGDYIVSSVVDTGVGIPQDEYQRIFEKFYQVDSSYTRSATGTGLGLFITKTIVELHGGNIWLESEIGHGSHFSFLLPKAKKSFRREKNVQNIGS
ncbi:MAG: hypothetical protein A2474_01430 [Elusimicrobia bacterium RIFOXYC2_FULL_34_12]|nr:MAG: hypothetical protein A2474_01430 [Elusimicrobia bacterium RIFOXYC2_FULL_34_12]OGS39339.1 MAG: hypothetical protein A2551_07200 [Elusimicrobia bacterium RIFOXYD2_FULL_34_30]